VSGDATASSGLTVGDGTAGKLNFNYQSGGTWSPVAGGTAINDDAWHHVVVTYNAGTVVFYVDGSVDGSYVGQGSAMGTTADPMSLGASTFPWAFLSGSLDAVGIWQRVLSALEVAALYNSGTGLEPA
jgi:hypothetical protein